jgi:hypothetical protein
MNLDGKVEVQKCSVFLAQKKGRTERFDHYYFVVARSTSDMAISLRIVAQIPFSLA